MVSPAPHHGPATTGIVPCPLDHHHVQPGSAGTTMRDRALEWLRKVGTVAGPDLCYWPPLYIDKHMLLDDGEDDPP